MKRLSIIIAICTFIPLFASAQIKSISGGYFGIGTTVGIMPKTDKIKLPDPKDFKASMMTTDKWPAICFAIDLGLIFWEHHRISYDWCGGSYGHPIGEYYKKGSGDTYLNTKTGQTYVDAGGYSPIKRHYKNRSQIFSYQYILHLKKEDNRIKSSIRFGPSLGTYQIKASTSPSDKMPKINIIDAEAKQKVYGFGTGITFYPNDFFYFDFGYRYLSCKGLEIIDFKTKGQVHQISMTIGIGTLSW